MTFRQKLYAVIDEYNRGNWAGRAFDFFIVGLITSNIDAIILESFAEIRQ